MRVDRLDAYTETVCNSEKNLNFNPPDRPSHTDSIMSATPAKLVQWGTLGLLLGSLSLSAGCATEGNNAAQAQPQRARDDRTITVEVAIAEPQSESDPLTYNGTTEPRRRVSLRARSDGQLLNLIADTGDPVFEGEVLAQIENNPLRSQLAASQAEVGAREAEVQEARNLRAEAETRVAEIRVELEQARIDARRFQNLARRGAVPEQEAELAQTAALALEQQLRAAEDQVRTRDRAIAAAEERVSAQEALVDGVRQQLAYTDVISPTSGVVLERLLESGDVVQTGDAILELGDFSQVEVRIDVPDRDRAQISLGQTVAVTLDAFPEAELSGRIAEISPAADPVARLIPVKIRLDRNTLDGELLSSGLLARVTVTPPPRNTLRIPVSALDVSADGGDTVFTLDDNTPEPSVRARPVELGDREDGQVEILDGLVPGDRFIVRSDRPLSDGQTVRRSFLSDE